jgi:hypothetical protein
LSMLHMIFHSKIWSWIQRCVSCFFFQPRHLFPIFRLPARQDYEGPQWIFVWMNGPLTSHVLQDLGALVATNFIASVTLWHTFSIQVEPITWWKRCKKAKHQRCIVLPNRAFLFW